MGTREKVRNALAKFEADAEADFSNEFSVTPPSKTFNAQGVQNPVVPEIRWASTQINGLMDETTKADTERVGRLLVSAWYACINDGTFKAPRVGESDWIIQSKRRSDVARVKKLKGSMTAFMEAADKLLSFVV